MLLAVAASFCVKAAVAWTRPTTSPIMERGSAIELLKIEAQN
jgi:hypothetical protein